jgi:hypothetical protein
MYTVCMHICICMIHLAGAELFSSLQTVTRDVNIYIYFIYLNVSTVCL